MFNGTDHAAIIVDGGPLRDIFHANRGKSMRAITKKYHEFLLADLEEEEDRYNALHGAANLLLRTASRQNGETTAREQEVMTRRNINQDAEDQLRFMHDMGFLDGPFIVGTAWMELI